MTWIFYAPEIILLALSSYNFDHQSQKMLKKEIGMKKSTRIISFGVLIFTIVLFFPFISCTHLSHQEKVKPSGLESQLTENLVGTWIISRTNNAHMKIIIEPNGRYQLYKSILDPVPLFWVNWEINGILEDKEGTHWLELTLYCTEPFCDERTVQSYAIAAFSLDNTSMIMTWDEDKKPQPNEESGYSILYYREGSKLAESVEDVPSKSAYVLIDYTEPAYLVFIGIPDGETLEKLRGFIDDDDSVNSESIEILPWEEFVPISSEIINSFVIYDQYEVPILIPGFIALLREYPGEQLGLTWDSGMAISRMDFIHSEDIYKEYISDPKEYGGTDDPRISANHPSVWFSQLLGW